MVFDKVTYYREYNRKNREKINVEHREQYSKNPTPFLQSSKKWRENHPEKFREYQRKNHQNHPETLKRAIKKYRETHPEAQKIANKKWRENHPEKFRECLYKSIRKWRRENPEKHRAHKIAQKNIQLSERCEFCLSKENLERHHPDYNYPLIVVTTCRECHKWIENKTMSNIEVKL